MLQQRGHGRLIAAAPGHFSPTRLKERIDSPFIQLLEPDFSALKPSAQIGCQFNLLPAICLAVALLRNQSRKTLEVRSQRSDQETVQLFRLRIKTNNHKCHSFLLRLKGNDTRIMPSREVKKG